MSNQFPDSHDIPDPNVGNIGPRSMQQDSTDPRGATSDEFAEWQRRNAEQRNGRVAATIRRWTGNK